MKTLKQAVVGAAAVALMLAICPMASGAQEASSSNPVSSALRDSVKSAAQKMVAAAEEMPADKYNYKPTPESMTFGRLVLHIATSNQGLCHTLSGEPAPTKTTLTPTSSKEELVGLLKSAFDYCNQSLAKVDDSKLSSQVPSFGGRTVTQAALMFTLSDDLADHYGQQASYLRLNGLLPPTAKKKE